MLYDTIKKKTYRFNKTTKYNIKILKYLTKLLNVISLKETDKVLYTISAFPYQPIAYNISVEHCQKGRFYTLPFRCLRFQNDIFIVSCFIWPQLTIRTGTQRQPRNVFYGWKNFINGTKKVKITLVLHFFI